MHSLHSDEYFWQFDNTTVSSVIIDRYEERILNSGIHLKYRDKVSFNIKQTLNALSEVQSLTLTLTLTLTLNPKP